MSKKLYILISTIVGAVGTIAAALVAYYQPKYSVAIIASIGIAVTAINEIMLQFVKDEPAKK